MKECHLREIYPYITATTWFWTWIIIGDRMGMETLDVNLVGKQREALIALVPLVSTKDRTFG